MKTRKHAKETVIKITSVGSTGFDNSYIGNLFVVDSFDVDGTPLTFVDWFQSPIRKLDGLGYDTEDDDNEPLKMNGSPALKILNVGVTGFSSAYIGKIFIINSFDSNGNPLTFIDWLKQSPLDIHIKSLSGFGYNIIIEDVWSITRKHDNERLTTSVAQYVREKLISRFLIFRGELAHYPDEETEMLSVGAESYFQKRKFEMDFIVREIISTTPFVIDIETFESSVDNEMRYSAKFKLNLTDGGTLAWQTDI